MDLNLFRLQVRKMLMEMVESPVMEDEAPGTGDFGTATARQRWALYLLTKKDYRQVNLSKEDASQLISQLNKEKGYVKQPQQQESNKGLWEYLMEHIGVMVKALREEMGMKGEIGDDPMFTPKEKIKKYSFFGSGMGFSFVHFDKRSRLGNAIMEEFGKLRPKFEKEILKKAFTPEEIKEFEAQGWPLQAMMFQNLSFNTKINYLVSKYMEEKGVKKVWVSSRLD